MKKWSCDEGKCSISYTLSVVGGRWKWLVLYKVFKNEVMRYSDIKKSMPSITHKMLSQQLKELLSAKLINRQEYSQIPPKVEYSLTEKGTSLIPILLLMSDWGEKNRDLDLNK